MYLGSLRTRCVYYAWYEFYPNPSITIGGSTVLPGDKISAEVSYSVGVFHHQHHRWFTALLHHKHSQRRRTKLRGMDSRTTSSMLRAPL